LLYVIGKISSLAKNDNDKGNGFYWSKTCNTCLKSWNLCPSHALLPISDLLSSSSRYKRVDSFPTYLLMSQVCQWLFLSVPLSRLWKLWIFHIPKMKYQKSKKTLKMSLSFPNKENLPASAFALIIDSYSKVKLR